jgi:RNA polymerase sigma-70 factor (ECF subfamily)
MGEDPAWRTPVTATTDRSDADLLRDSRTNAAAFRELYDRHAGRLHTFLLRRTRDPTAAFEATAETFAEAWLSRARFRDPGDGSAGPWLFGIARNVVAAAVRRRAMDRTALERIGLCVEPSVDPPDPAWLDGLDADLAAALAELSEDQRRAVELRVLEDRDYDDVARTLAISPGAARVRVHRGVTQMRRRLSAPSDS